MAELALIFDGRETDDHVIDARQLGNSLIGLDKAVASAAFVMVHGRLPHGRERVVDIYVAAKSPEEGSVSLPTIIGNVPWILPLAGEIIASYGVDFIRNFLSWLLLFRGGRKSEAQVYMDAMIDVLKENNRSHEASNEAWQRTLLSLADKLAPAAKQIVDPVGRTASVLRLGDKDTGAAIDEPTADAIRSKEELEVTDKEVLRATIDGLIRRSRTLKLIMEDGSYQTAEVRDPTFDVEPNIYIDALAHGTAMDLTVRKALRSGKLYKVYVLEAEPAE